MRGFLILLSMLGYSIATKVWAYIKANKIDVEGWDKTDFEKLMEDPRFKKYMR